MAEYEERNTGYLLKYSIHMMLVTCLICAEYEKYRAALISRNNKKL